MASQIPGAVPYTRIMAPPANLSGAPPGRPSAELTPSPHGTPDAGNFTSSNGGYSVGAPAPPAGFQPPLHAPYMNPPPPPPQNPNFGTSLPGLPPPSQAAPPVAPNPGAVMPGTSLPGLPPPGSAAPTHTPQHSGGVGAGSPQSAPPGALGTQLGLTGRPYIHDFTPDHLATLAPGQQVDTKFGTVSRDASGKVALRLSDAGSQHYARAHAAEVAKYGAHPLSGIPGAPQPPIEPGKPNLNPFTGQWTDGWTHHKLGR